MASSITTRVHTTTWSIVFSVLMIAAGVLAIGLPQVAGIAVTEVVAWLLIFSGALHVAFAWRPSHAAAAIWEVLMGLAYRSDRLLPGGTPGHRAGVADAGCRVLSGRRGHAGIRPVFSTSVGARCRMVVVRWRYHPRARGADREHVAVERRLGAGHAGWGEHVLQRHHSADAHADSPAGLDVIGTQCMANSKVRQQFLRGSSSC